MLIHTDDADNQSNRNIQELVTSSAKRRSIEKKYFNYAIVSLNCYTAKCGRRNAEVRVASMGVALTGSLALAAEPTFHNVFRLPVNKSVPKNKVTLH